MKIKKFGLLVNHYLKVTKHKLWVLWNIIVFGAKLFWRGLIHDLSKYGAAEAPLFAKMTPLLKTTEFGTKAYDDLLKELRSALTHHYQHNSHHPEAHVLGMAGFDLLDLIEMWADWSASVRRHETGNILASVFKNQARFQYPPMLRSILQRSVQQRNMPVYKAGEAPKPYDYNHLHHLVDFLGAEVRVVMVINRGTAGYHFEAGIYCGDQQVGPGGRANEPASAILAVIDAIEGKELEYEDELGQTKTVDVPSPLYW